MNGRYLRRSVIAVCVIAAMYFGATAVATRNYWAGLFWGTYLYWLPAIDIIETPKRAIIGRRYHAAAIKFIQGKMLTPTTAKFCPYSEVTVGVLKNKPALSAYVDAQNQFGAMIRRHYVAVFGSEGYGVDYVDWGDGEIWH